MFEQRSEAGTSVLDVLESRDDNRGLNRSSVINRPGETPHSFDKRGDDVLPALFLVTLVDFKGFDDGEVWQNATRLIVELP
jgi:hypothetical protein